MSATRTDAKATATERRPDRIVRSEAPEQRFRAATVDEALAQARAALGADAEIVEANRIRRGGIGGFFATELGVEIVARGTSGAERSDVFEPFDAAAALAPAPAPAPAPTRTPAPGAPPLRSWTVDQGLDAHVPGPSMPPARARQAWRDASRDTSTDQLPGLESAPAEPTTFAEHFLRELVQDAEELRRTPDRNRVLPVREAAERAAHEPADRDEVVVRRRTAPLMSAGATVPLGHQEPLAGMPVAAPSPTPVRTAQPATVAPAAPAPAAEEPQTLPGMPAPAPKKRARAKRAGTGTVRSTAERRAEAAAAEAAAAAQAAAAAEAAAAPSRAMVGELIEQCVALTSSADASTAPSRIALAVTLPDGSVMKVSIERPRRAVRSVRDAAGA